MTPKPDSTASKAVLQKPTQKSQKSPYETARLFVHVDEVVRRSQALRMTRYVE